VARQVEGFEDAVLSGLDLRRYNLRIVSIEAPSEAAQRTLRTAGLCRVKTAGSPLKALDQIWVNPNAVGSRAVRICAHERAERTDVLRRSIPLTSSECSRLHDLAPSGGRCATYAHLGEATCHRHRVGETPCRYALGPNSSGVCFRSFCHADLCMRQPVYVHARRAQEEGREDSTAATSESTSRVSAVMLPPGAVLDPTPPCDRRSGQRVHFDFIEIGTSSFHTLLQSRPAHERGLSVDPMLVHLNKLPSRKRKVRVHAAISEASGSTTVFFIDPHDISAHRLPFWLSGCNMIGQPHRLASRELEQRGLGRLMRNTSVRVLSLRSLLEAFCVGSIGTLKIDTEGHDTVIMRSLFDDVLAHGLLRAPPERVKYEANWLDAPRRAAMQRINARMVQEYGYRQTWQLGPVAHAGDPSNASIASKCTREGTEGTDAVHCADQIFSRTARTDDAAVARSPASHARGASDTRPGLTHWASEPRLGPDGFGSQLHRIIGLWCICQEHSTLVRYVHTPLVGVRYQGLHTLQHGYEGGSAAGALLARISERLRGLEAYAPSSSAPFVANRTLVQLPVSGLQWLKGLQPRVLYHILAPFAVTDRRPAIYYRHARPPAPIFTAPTDILMAAAQTRPQAVAPLTIGIHVRRGELFIVDSWRMMPNSYCMQSRPSLNHQRPHCVSPCCQVGARIDAELGVLFAWNLFHHRSHSARADPRRMRAYRHAAADGRAVHRGSRRQCVPRRSWWQPRHQRAHSAAQAPSAAARAQRPVRL
jgi:hypothetical protein